MATKTDGKVQTAGKGSVTEKNDKAAGAEKKTPGSTKAKAKANVRDPFHAYGQLDAAVARFAERPSPDASERLAELLADLTELNDFSGVNAVYDRVAAIAATQGYALVNDTNFYFKAANARLRVGRVTDCERMLREILEVSPQHVSASRLLASILRHTDIPGAAAVLRNVSTFPSFRSDLSSVMLYLEMVALTEGEDRARAEMERLNNSKTAQELHLFAANLEGDAEAKLARYNAFLEMEGLGPVRLAAGATRFSMDDLAGGGPQHFDGPLVSIIMTTYNSERYVRTAIRSLQNQTYGNWELWIVDDCSSDGTRDILRELAAQDNRLKLILREQNGGTYVAKNLALARANGEFATCHDSDDWSHPEKLFHEVKLLNNSPDRLGCFSRWVRIDDEGLFSLKNWGRYTHVNPASLIFRRQFVVENLGFFDSVRVGADTEFRMRMCAKYGWNAIGNLRPALVLGRLHDASLTRSGAGVIDEYGISPVRRTYTSSWLDWHVGNFDRNKDALFRPLDQDGYRFTVPAEIMPDRDVRPASATEGEKFERFQGGIAEAAAVTRTAELAPAADRTTAMDGTQPLVLFAQGALDPELTDGCVTGWAIDSSERRRRVDVAVSVDGKPVGIGRAQEPRPDLARVFGRTLACGFTVPLPSWCFDGREHVVTAEIRHLKTPLRQSGFKVRASSLPAGPRTSAAAAEALAEGDVTLVSARIIGGWVAAPNATEAPTKVIVSTDTGFRTEIALGPVPRGVVGARLGFRLEVPAALRDGRAHHVTVSTDEPQAPLANGRFRFGPYHALDGAVTASPEQAGTTVLATCFQPDGLFGPADVRIGEAVEIGIRADDVPEGIAVFAVPALSIGEARVLRYGSHTLEEGVQRPNVVRLRPTKTGKGTMWRAVLRPVPSGNADLAPGTVAKLTLRFEFRPIADLDPDADLSGLARVAGHGPVLLRKVSPVIDGALDTAPKERDDPGALALATAAASFEPADALDNFSSYIAPRVIGFVRPDVAADLSAATEFTPLDPSAGRAAVIATRPDLVVLQAERFARDKAYGAETVAGITAAVRTARTLGARVAVLFDSDADAEAERLSWLIGEADVVVDLVHDDPARLQALARPGAEVICEGAFVAPARSNPFRTAGGAGAADAADLLDGAADLLTPANAAALGALKAVCDRLHLIESRYDLDRAGAVALGAFYWNLLGTTDFAGRRELLRRYERLLLLPATSLGGFERRRLVAEAVAHRTLPVRVPGAGAHAFDGALAGLWPKGAPLPTLGETSGTGSESLRQGLLRTLYRERNLTALVHRLLRPSAPLLAAGNEAALTPKIAMVLVARHPRLVDRAIESFARQAYPAKELVVVLHGDPGTADQQAAWKASGQVTALAHVARDKTPGHALNLAVDLTDADYVAPISEGDLYGPHYLADFALYMQCRRIELFARPAAYCYRVDRSVLTELPAQAAEAFRVHDAHSLPADLSVDGTLIARRSLVTDLGFSESRRGGIEADLVRRAVGGGAALTLGDRFSFSLCRYGTADDHGRGFDEERWARSRTVLAGAKPEDVHGVVDGVEAASAA